MMYSDFYERPNRLQKSKRLKYHKDYAKWVLSCVNMGKTQEFITKSLINWAFYKGNQWIFSEDLDPFLMDESGEVRNRIKFVQNTIRPYVEYYRGSAIRMDITARVSATSTQAIDRRQYALEKAKFITGISKEIPRFKETLSKNFPIGDDMEETEDMHANLYIDKYEEDVNNIISKIEADNDVEDLKVRCAHHIALDGIAVLKEEERFGSQTWSVTESRKFFFDTTAKRPDLKDAEFMGEWSLESTADIVEVYKNVTKTVLSKLEKASSLNAPLNGLHGFLGFESHSNSGKIPVYKVYWRDLEEEEFGIVMDDFGYPLLTTINNKRSKYTTKDLLSKNELEKYKEDVSWIKDRFCDKDGKVQSNTVMILGDVVRYAHIVPSEYLSNGSDDIVLDYGVRKYVNKYSYMKRFPDYPYKVYCWSYNDGEILSPIDDLISPQRFINRVLSMGESQVNNMRGSGLIYDKNTIDSQGGEEELLRSVNQSKPVGIDGPVNNSIGSYSSNNSGALQMFQIASMMDQISKGMIGGGDALIGQGGAYRASATVNNQNVNQGTTMQEPVFYCLHKILTQMYESMANRGRRILAANKRELVFTVGDKGSQRISLTRDFDIEDFRANVVRVTNPQQEKQYADEMLLALLERKLIGNNTFAKYFGKSSMKDVGYAIREHTQLVIEQQRQQQKQQEKLQEVMANKQEVGNRVAMELGNMEQQEALAMSYGQAKIEEDMRNRNEVTKGLQ